MANYGPPPGSGVPPEPARRGWHLNLKRSIMVIMLESRTLFALMLPPNKVKQFQVLLHSCGQSLANAEFCQANIASEDHVVLNTCLNVRCEHARHEGGSEDQGVTTSAHLQDNATS